jgi:hypothetical protein
MNEYILFGFSYYVFQELGLLVAVGFVILGIALLLKLYTSLNDRS